MPWLPLATCQRMICVSGCAVVAAQPSLHMRMEHARRSLQHAMTLCKVCVTAAGAGRRGPGGPQQAAQK